VSCPAIARIASAASGEDEAAALHAETCARCSLLLDEQREVAALLHAMPGRRLSSLRRDEIAAEVMARADDLSPPSHRRHLAIAAGVLAAAAVLVLVMWSRRGRDADAPGAPALAASETGEVSTRATTHEESVAPASEHPDSVVHVGDGTLHVEPTAQGAIVGDGAQIALHAARADITAKAGVIVAARVFAGSVEITTGDRRIVISAGEEWTADPKTEALAAFRDGWQALRDGRNADAIAAFDRATDPVVAEDAAYWAAIAAERAGQTDEAHRRFAAFVAAFPQSPRVAAARAKL
jgi:hypothetical protein